MVQDGLSRIGVHIFPNALKFIKLLGSSAAEPLAKFHRTTGILTPSSSGSRICKISWTDALAYIKTAYMKHELVDIKPHER